LAEIKSDIKWEPKEKFHITLKFLGDIEETILIKITEELKHKLTNFGSFSVEYKSLGTFPNLKQARVVWIAEQDKEKKVYGLNKTIEGMLKNYNFKDESNRFHPHITLGRVKGICGIKEVIELMQQHEHESITDFASEVCIMKSTLTRSGSLFDIIDIIKL